MTECAGKEPEPEPTPEITPEPSPDTTHVPETAAPENLPG